MGFPGGSDGKESACKAGDLGSIPGWGRFPGEGNGYPLQYFCLENSVDRGAWQAIYSSWGQKELDTTERLSQTLNVCIRAKSLQLCLTLCDPMDCSQPGSSVHGIFHARILEWVAISYSRGFSPPRDRTRVSCVSCIASRFFTL